MSIQQLLAPNNFDLVCSSISSGNDRLLDPIFRTDMPSHCLGLKQMTASGGADTLASQYIGSGICRKLWLALYSPSYSITSIYVRVEVDGHVVWGNTTTTSSGDGVNQIGLSTDLLFTPAGGGTISYFTKHIGNNMFRSAQLGGYVGIDIPFKSSLKIYLKNSQVQHHYYWIQPQLELISQLVMEPVLYTSHCDTFKYTGTTYGSEYPLLNVKGLGNGVHIFGIKMYIDGIAGPWWESRVRAYQSDNGFGTSIMTPWTGYSDASFDTPVAFSGAVNGSVIHISSGLEDLFNHSWGWSTTLQSGVNAYASDDTGLLYQSKNFDYADATTSISCYRFFTNDMIHSIGDKWFSLTLPSGDPKVSTGIASMTIVGQIWYYV